MDFCQFRLFFEPLKVFIGLKEYKKSRGENKRFDQKLGSGIIFKIRLNSMKLVIICSAFCITACFNSKRQSIPSIFSRSSEHFINKAWVEYASRSLLPISLSKSCRFFISSALLLGLTMDFELMLIGYHFQPIRHV